MSEISILLRYSATLVQPLVAPDVRARIDADVAELDRRIPGRFADWCAGMACDIAASLPADDPWKASEAFDHTDLAPGLQDDPREDPTTLPWASGPTPAAREVIARACTGDLATTRLALLDCRDTNERLNTIHRLLARRQAYVGISDPWVMIAAQERAFAPTTTEPTWIDHIDDGTYARITSDGDDGFDDRLRWLLDGQ